MATINKKEGFRLDRPKNSWDMNYHLYDFTEGKDYLIDICDVYDEVDRAEMEENGGLAWEILAELKDIDYIKEFAWKTIEL